MILFYYIYNTFCICVYVARSPVFTTFWFYFWLFTVLFWFDFACLYICYTFYVLHFQIWFTVPYILVLHVYVCDFTLPFTVPVLRLILHILRLVLHTFSHLRSAFYRLLIYSSSSRLIYTLPTFYFLHFYVHVYVVGSFSLRLFYVTFTFAVVTFIYLLPRSFCTHHTFVWFSSPRSFTRLFVYFAFCAITRSHTFCSILRLRLVPTVHLFLFYTFSSYTFGCSCILFVTYTFCLRLFYLHLYPFTFVGWLVTRC